MDYTPLVLLLLPCFVWLCFHFLILGSTHRKSFQARLPPGPRPLPIIGNLLELGDKPHQSLTTLSRTYGPLMSLKLGSTTTIVISSPKTAQEVLNKKDQAFASRTVLNAIQIQDHHKFSMVFLPASAHWRNLRKICSMQIFSPQRVEASQDLRRKVVQQLLEHARESCNSGRAVDVGRAAFTTALNLLSNTFFSVDLAHYDSNLSQEFKDLIWSIMVEAGRPNLADFFPGLRLVDPQGIQKRMTVYFNKLVDVFDGFINQRLPLKASSPDNDVLDALLNLNKQHDHELSCNDIRHLLTQIMAAIRGHKLQDFLDPTKEAPQKFLSNQDEARGKINPEFLEREQQDQLLVSWLLSSMTESLLTRMVGCDSAAQIWRVLDQYFASQTRAKISQYKTHLRNTRKGSLSINEYLLKIKNNVDKLASVGYIISLSDHIEAIFNGLTEEYDTFIVSVNSRTDPYTIEEIESLLLAQEARIEKHNKELDSASPIANLTTYNRRQNRGGYNGSNFNHQNFNSRTGRGQNSQSSRGSFNGSRGFQQQNIGGRGGRNGKQSWNSNNRPQCQLCGKIGHVVIQCWYRFDENFVPQTQSNSTNNPGSPMAAMLATPQSVYDTNWYPDSGATNHVTPTISNLMTCMDYTGNDQIHMGNGTGQQGNPNGRES